MLYPGWTTVGGECVQMELLVAPDVVGPSTIAIRMAVTAPDRFDVLPPAVATPQESLRSALIQLRSNPNSAAHHRKVAAALRTLGRDAHADKSDEQARRIEERVVAQETTRHVPDLQQRLADRARHADRAGIV